MAQHQLTSRFRVGGVLTSTTATVLADPTGSFGIERTSDNRVEVSVDTAMTEDSTGVYRYNYVDSGTGVVNNPVAGESYRAWVKHTYGGADYYQEIEFTISSDTGSATDHPTLEDADGWVTAMLKETDTSGRFGTAQRYRAIYMVANRIQHVTRCYKRSTNISLVNGTTDYVVGGASYLDDSNFSWDRVERMWIDGYDELEKYASENTVREAIAGSATGRPEGYFPYSRTAMIIDKDPDQTYTLTVRDFPEIAIAFDEGSPSTVDIQIPRMWLYNGLNCGAWHYLTNTRSEYNFGAPGGAEFEAWLETLGGYDVKPVICRPNTEYGLTGSNRPGQHVEDVVYG